MSDREKLPEWIDRFNNNDLEGVELEKFLALLRENPRLREELQLDKELNKILKDEDVLELRRKIKKVRRRKGEGGKEEGRKEEGGNGNLRLLLLAAMIVVLVGIVFLMFWFTRAPGILMNKEHYTLRDTLPKENRKNISISPADSENRKPEKKLLQKTLLADNFRPDPAMESLVGSAIRDGAFRLLSPKDSSVFTTRSEIVFTWNKSGREQIRLMILNNRGKTIAGPITTFETTEKLKASQFRPGLYYFKIIKGEELLHVGKFIIN